MVDGVTEYVTLGKKKFSKRQKTVQVSINVPVELKREFERYCKMFDLKTSEAYRTIYEETVREFRELEKQNNSTGDK